MNAKLTVVLAATFLLLLECITWSVKILKIKKQKKNEGHEIPKAEKKFGFSIALCWILESLLYLVPMQLFYLVIIGLCAVLGAYNLFRERYETISAVNKES